MASLDGSDLVSGEGAELGPHAPLSQVVTPNRGRTQACRMNQRIRTPTGIRKSIVLLLSKWCLKGHGSSNVKENVIIADVNRLTVQRSFDSPAGDTF